MKDINKNSFNRSKKTVLGKEKDEKEWKKGKKTFTKDKKQPFKKRTGETPTYNFTKVKGWSHQPKEADKDPNAPIRLNRYIANAGICSRREADTLIANGSVTVNENVIKEMGFKVSSKDVVKYKGRLLSREKFVYVLLNKPKDFITTTSDPKERRTVMKLVSTACQERIYPIGRLDRQTTGLLLFTNDGELAAKLAHPSSKMQKIYHVTLNKALQPEDQKKIIQNEIVLEDGPVPIDGFNLLNTERTEMGLELHIGRNRIVRRIFEHLGYDVVRLDRTVYAGLTKIDLPRGKWRYLNEKEVIKLKFF